MNRTRIGGLDCDTDVLSALIRRDPPLDLVRRLAALPPAEQCTTSVTLGELDLPLVTGNVRHFSCVPDLQIESWLAA